MNTHQNSLHHPSFTNKKRLHSTLYSTAAIVTGLSVAERTLGFLYRIVLSRLIGAEGLGLYQVALSVFAVFLTLGTGGIPITVSRLITKGRAENDARAEHRATGAGIALSLLCTLPFCLLFGLSENTFSFLFSDDRCFPVFRILLIGLVFSSLYAVIRGSFWGNKCFLAPSVMEIAEESVMVIAGVLLLQKVNDPLSGAMGAAWAAVISYLFSCTISFAYFFLRGGKIAMPKKLFKPLILASTPITSVRVSGTLISSAVSVLLPVMLMRAGMAQSQALSAFGVASGMALPVLMIPATIIGSLSLVLVPELSEDYYRKNHTRVYQNLSRGILVATLLALFLLPFFYALGDNLGKLAFSNALAGELIRKGCILLLPMSVAMITTSMLNALGFERQTFIIYFISAAALLVCIFFLPAVCGVFAYIIGMGANFTVCCICNLLLLYKKCRGLYAEHLKTWFFVFFRAAITLLPLSVFGRFCFVLLQNVMGELFALLLSSMIIAASSFCLWIALRILPKHAVKQVFLKFFRSRKKA